MRINVLALAALAVLPAQVACDFDSLAESSERFREDFQYSYNLKPGGKISVDNFNGPVEIMSWEKDSVQITGTKYAGREETLKDLRIETKADDNSVEIRTVRPYDRHGNMGAKYFIRVPRQVELERIHSSNGQIRVEDIQGNARLETSNGAIRVRKLSGQLEAKTSNGAIEGGDLETTATLRTSNGTIRLDHVRGALEAVTSNGGIHLGMFTPAAQQALRFETSNGGIDVALEKFNNNEIRASTSNGSITLRVPATLNAQLRASASHSSITSELDVMHRGTISRDHLEGDVNGGGPLIQLTTSNGSIRILKL